jgi:hypothetical protein
VGNLWVQDKYVALATPIPFATWREAQLMLAEAQGGQQAVTIINRLRTTNSGLAPTIASRWPAAGLPTFASTDNAAIRAQVIDERQRELYLQGQRIGDLLRYNIPFPIDQTPRTEQYGPLTCIPMSLWEEIGNPNF